MHFEYNIETPFKLTIRIEGPDRSMAMAWLREVLGDCYGSAFFRKVEQPSADPDVVLNEAVEPIAVRFPFTVEQQPWLWWRKKIANELAVINNINNNNKGVYYYTTGNENLRDAYGGECKPINLHKDIFNVTGRFKSEGTIEGDDEQLAFGVLMEEFCDPYIAAFNYQAFCEEHMEGQTLHEERWDIRDWLLAQGSDFEHVSSVLIEEIQKRHKKSIICGPHWKDIKNPWETSLVEHDYEFTPDTDRTIGRLNIRLKTCLNYIVPMWDLTDVFSLLERWAPANGFVQHRKAVEKRIDFSAPFQTANEKCPGEVSMVGGFRDHLFHIHFVMNQI